MHSLYNKKLYTDSYKIKIAAYYFRNWDNFKMDSHAHERIEIMYVVNGKCTIEVKGEEFLLTSSDMVLIDAGIPHKIVMNDEHCRMINIEFLFESTKSFPSVGMLLGDRFISSKLLGDKKEFIVLKNCSELYSSLSGMLGELSYGSDDDILQLQAAQMLLKIADSYKNDKKSVKSKSVVYINRAIEFINTNYHENIMLNDIASAADINRNYLQRKFKEYTGKTITEYINGIRIKKAKQLLQNTDIPIADLCLYVGINSRQYFTMLFTKLIGISPKQYRMNFKNSSW
jgi:AraC-like DNA-binding protein